MPGFNLGDLFAKIPMPRFGDLLYQHRTLRGIGVDELATAVNIAPSALRDIEAGKRPAPPENVAKAMADALGLDKEDRETFLDAADLQSPMMHALTGRKMAPATPPALSAAIHAFLIADIRGYTAYTQRFGDNAAAQLSTRFADIARSVLERWDGRLVEVRGDEVLGVFASARQAVLAAGELHARYEEERLQHPDMPIGIGVGLDLGEAVPVGDGYRGAALNRSARLCSLAGPGETLVSPGIVYVAPQIEGVEFRARGQEQLKGFAEPVPILLAAPGPVVDAASAPEEALTEPLEDDTER
jgi:class 3 adenylate cyclase